MHTYTNSLTNTSFIFNSDFSGDVEIVRPGNARIRVPAEAILSFVAYRYVLRNRIDDLENQTYKDILV